MQDRTVAELIQSRTPITVSPSASLAQALCLCNEKSVHRLPVVDDSNALVGLVSVSDLRLACESPLFHSSPEMKKHMKEKKVSEVMHKSVQTCELTDTVLTASKLLRVGAVGGLVVTEVDTKKVVGVVSRSDMLDELIRLLEPEGVGL